MKVQIMKPILCSLFLVLAACGGKSSSEANEPLVTEPDPQPDPEPAPEETSVQYCYTQVDGQEMCFDDRAECDDRAETESYAEDTLVDCVEVTR